MNYNIAKIKEEAEDLYGEYDSNSGSSIISPWETSSRFIHHEQQVNIWKKQKRRQYYYSTNDESQSSDEDDTIQPKVAHMKPPQQQQEDDVTRLSANHSRNFQQDYNCSADKLNTKAAAVAALALLVPAPEINNNSHADDIAGIGAGGDDYEQNFSFDTTLSPSSSIMYHHHHPTSISPSPSSSKMMMMMDKEYYDNITTNSGNTISSMMGRESILMKQALKTTKKRRESIGEVVAITRKRPVSTSVIPRLTKSSNIISSQQQPQHKRTNSTATTSIKQKRRYYSLQKPLSQKDRNDLASLGEPKQQEEYLQQQQQQQQQDTTAGVHWDPHIDAFEILRAKITGITRSMQEFHVQELFQDEKRKKKKLTATTSSPLITTTTRNNISNNRRFSLASSSSLSNFRDDLSNNYNNNRLSFLGHRRIRSQSYVPSSSHADTNNFETAASFYNNDKSDYYNDYNYHYGDEEEEEEKDLKTMTSPNLTALFLTTNNLIHSRLDELSETASIKSMHEDINEVNSILEWQKKFLSLVTRCIHQSEELESLSTDVLNTEHRVRELMLVHDTIHEQFNEREKQYEERIRECQDVAQQQLMMIDSLEELTADINMKIESRRREVNRQEALLALDANCYSNSEDDIDYLEQDTNNKRWNFQRSVADLLNMDDKHDMIQKMRWDIGMFVGGGVGTGHIIHSFEDKLNGIDMMIAGTGTTTTPITTHHQQQYYDVDEDDYNSTDDEYNNQTESYSISPSIRHIKLYQHQYILHLSSKDRRTRFSMLPKCLWVPDHETNQCQFQLHNHRKRCQTQFTFFQRKHHCRRCGYIVCQRHSANRLPLFSTSKIYSTTGQWSRVCDNCFHDLIMQK